MAINKINYKGTEFDIGGENYSTEEQIVGTWLGEPLYRKAAVFTNEFSVNTWHDLDLNISDFKDVLNVHIFFKFANIWKPVPCTHPTVGWESYIGDMSNGRIAVRFGEAFTDTNTVTEVRVIIEYTKTIVEGVSE